LRAKFKNDSNFLVHEIGRGTDLEERSLEMTEVSHGLWSKVMETGIRFANIME